MDNARFDSAVRRAADTTTRRGILGLLAGLSGLVLSDSTDAKRK